MDETRADVEIERAALRYELARTRRELAEAQATIRLLTGDLDAARHSAHSAGLTEKRAGDTAGHAMNPREAHAVRAAAEPVSPLQKKELQVSEPRAENERRNIWPGQTWRNRKSGETIRLDEIALSGMHAEGVVIEPANERRRAPKSGLVTRSTVGERRRVHFTTLERSWDRR